jgi:hypothetical protein
MVVIFCKVGVQGLGRPKSSMGLWPHILQFQWAISRFNGPSKYFEEPFQGVQVNSAPGEFGTCSDRTVYYCGKMQNMLYSAEMPNSLGAELTRIHFKLVF